MPVHLFNINDEPVLDDILNRMLLVAEVAQVVQESRPPQVFAIHGDWGAGKTSFLKQVCKRYQENGAQVAEREQGNGAYEKLSFIWFEAWRYQQESTPIVALLHEIRDHFGAISKSLGCFKKLGEVGIRGLLRTFTELSLTIGPVGIKTGSLAQNVHSEGERWEQDHLAVSLPTAKIRKFLEQAIRQLLGGEADDTDIARRLIIVVDDLDRCEGEAVVRFLEGIKIYLNLNNCVFLLGLNQREVSMPSPVICLAWRTN